MKKELEALDQIKDTFIKNEYGESRGSSYDYGIGLYEEIKKYLTPPTADEVCKALSEYLGYNVIYGTHYTFVGENEICWFEHGRVVFNMYDLPPHLITLIGRFYEGLEQ